MQLGLIKTSTDKPFLNNPTYYFFLGVWSKYQIQRVQFYMWIQGLSRLKQLRFFSTSKDEYDWADTFWCGSAMEFMIISNKMFRLFTNIIRMLFHQKMQSFQAWILLTITFFESPPHWSYGLSVAAACMIMPIVPNHIRLWVFGHSFMTSLSYNFR